MEETYLLKHPGVKKKIMHGGRGPLPHFPSGTKLVFHFQTLLDAFERTVIDDSRKNKQPTEIFVGKMFKMEVWEVLLTSMRIGEVAEFWCDAIHTGLYPIVSKGMRLAAQGRDPLEGQKHTCGMGNVFHYHSTGFPELDELMRVPQPLIFIMELISVGEPFSYHPESWLMGKDEKMQLVPSLHLQGNSLVRERRYREASEKYKEAVLLLRIVQSREMPGDEDYIKLSKLIIPLVLNYCQCMLELEEYYEVIEHTTELIDKHKDCVKAYYKRAKAYAAVWSEKEAKRDFLMVSNLDITLARLVQKELQLLSERMKEKYWEDKEMYWKKLDEKEKNKGEEEGDKEKEVIPDRQEELKHQNENFQCPQKEVKEEQAHMSAEATRQNSQIKESAPEADLTKGNDRQQMLRLIMLLQDEGTFYIKEKRFSEAMEKFKKALEYVDYLQNQEVDYKGEDWESLEKVRLPLTLNLSQCKLELGEYQEVVAVNSKLLKTHEDNLKAIYQRARAHSALFNDKEARRDFSRAERLDPDLKPIIKQELKKLSENLRAKYVHEKKNYWTISREKWEQEVKSKQFHKTEGKCAEKSNGGRKNRDKGQAMKIKSSDKADLFESQGQSAASAIARHPSS
ncbi:aryl-hydrocarbon-interacting protein-like 1 [Trichomycterus rosablanca]|uniref:aryl-hydrocarbon-interacting protein-like 1 n=1 Tax=Trichomycterus rosablanca TaxID=2290929 RepID=UPI002F34F147